MKINWFPGHMKKALSEINKQLSKVDVVIYVLDSRAPLSSINPSLNNLIKGKSVLYVFNKIDLADEERVKEIVPRFKGESYDYIILNSTMSGAGAKIKNKLASLAKVKIEKYKAKGVNITIRAMVVGVPNSGKSTLVNNLCGKAKAITGDKAGVTKSNLWLNIGGNIELCDTPGTLYPNLADQKVAKHLAFVGSIKDEVVDETELAEELLKTLLEGHKEALFSRYGQVETLEDIANKRGFKLSGGVPDIERSALALIDDFRKGRIGRITLD